MHICEFGRAPNPRRVSIFLAEKGIDVERREVALTEGEHRKPGHLRRNPFASVPYLVLDDGMVIAESIAICRYFDALKPEPYLFGASHLERALVEMWNRRMEFNLFLPVTAAVRHTHPGMAALEPVQIPQWGQLNIERAKKTMRILDRQLARHEFIAGDRFTVADITAICALNFMRIIKLTPDPGHKSLLRWRDQVMARPSVSA